MKQCVEYTKQTLPQAQLYGGAHGMGSEDFGSISQACTANYMMIGAAAGPINECYGQHNPHVRFNGSRNVNCLPFLGHEKWEAFWTGYDELDTKLRAKGGPPASIGAA